MGSARESSLSRTQRANYEKLLLPSPQKPGQPIGIEKREARAIEVAIALEVGKGPVATATIVKRVHDVFGMAVLQSRVTRDVEYTSKTGSHANRTGSIWTWLDSQGRVKKQKQRYKETAEILASVLQADQHEGPDKDLVLGLPLKAIDLAPPPARVKSTTTRILRDTAVALEVKALHNYRCQLCGHSIGLRDGGFYSEAHHIQPLGRPHNGPDVLANVLCVCPNHHAELDYGATKLKLNELTRAAGHEIGAKYIKYHNTSICVDLA